MSSTSVDSVPVPANESKSRSTTQPTGAGGTTSLSFPKPFLSRKSKSLSSPEMIHPSPPVTLALESEETTSSGLKWGRARNRKKSRRMTLLQACAESVDGQTGETTDSVANSSEDCKDTVPPLQNYGANRSEDSAGEKKLSSAEPKERKISRIFWMLQSMQQAFIQQPAVVVESAASKSAETPAPVPVAPNTAALPTEAAVIPVTPGPSSSKGVESGSKMGGSSIRDIPPHLRTLQGLGQSQDSMAGFSHLEMPLKNPIRDRLARFGSINSWAGSEYSESSLISSSTASSAPPPLVHSVPYHKDGWTSMFIVASSTYAQLLVVVCIVSVFSEVATNHVPVLYYEGFFTYLYAVSLLFFLYVFGYLMRSKRRKALKDKERKIGRWRRQRAPTAAIDMDTVKVGLEHNPVDEIMSPNDVIWTPSAFDAQSMDEGQPKSNISFSSNSTVGSSQQHHHSDIHRRKSKKLKVSENEHSHGSFFLRAGAVAFGLGTMIYDGLEFGAFLEIPVDSPCYALLRGVNPVLHAIFVFFQMYFIFVSARLNIHKFKAIARFGLMHCLATNVCVWIRTLVRESLKEIHEHAHHHLEKSSSTSGGLSHHDDGHHSTLGHAANETDDALGLWELTGNVSCGRNVFLGDFIMDAAPFLYPFLIEYSLIGAAVLYVLWAHIGLNPKYISDEGETERPRGKSQLRVDCLGSSKGLFIGLFLLAVSLLCLVLFFVFAHQPEYRWLGLVLADGAHCALLIVSLVAMAIGAYRTRNLTFHAEHTEEIGNILLRVSALGIFAYSVFSIIAGALGPRTDEPPLLVLVNGLLSLIQVAAQMLFISDMSRRRVSSPEDDRNKPGRQTITFLLITNITLWLVYTFEMQKVEANPVQMHFYGFLPWAVIQRITLPLCIFYRFHSFLTFTDIWKNTYRSL